MASSSMGNNASALTTMSIARASTCLEAYLDAGIPTMLWGSMGIGKSDIVRQICARRGFGLVDFRAAQRDPVDVRGLPLVDDKTGTTRWLASAELPQEIRDGKEGILFCDELTHAAPAMQGALFQLFLDRAIGEYKLPSGWKMVAAGNRSEDRAGVHKMLAPLANRMAHIDVVPDLNSWLTWARKEKLNPELIAFLQFREELLHQMPEGNVRAFPTPRSWAQVSKIVEADSDIRIHLIAGLVGSGPAGEFGVFLETWEKLVPIFDQIIKNPNTATVPDARDMSIASALVATLGKRATKESFPKIIAYAKRLPKELEVLCVTNCTARNPELAECREFAAWAVSNPDVKT